MIHIEIQSQREGDFSKRMHVYNYRIFDRYDREVVSLAILADDDPAWRPSEFSYGRWGFRTGTVFPSIKLLDYRACWPELEASANPFAIVVMAHLKTLETRHTPEDRRASKLRLVKGLYERGMTAEDVRKLFRFIDWIMNLPPLLDDGFWHDVHQYEEEKRMPFLTTPERIGLQRGLLAGIEGCLKLKFGEEGLRLMPELRELRDHDLLQKILDAVHTATSPEDLRRVWLP